jgi:hypothetical protein
VIRYYLKSAGDSTTITVLDSAGAEVARLRGSGAAGINTVVWSTRRQTAGRGGGRVGTGTVIDQLLPLGRYTLNLQAGNRKLSQRVDIVKTQGWPLGAKASTLRVP